MRKLPGGELEVFLCRKGDWAQFDAKLSGFLSRHALVRAEARIPLYPATKKEQLPRWNVLWPVSFHRQEPYVDLFLSLRQVSS